MTCESGPWTIRRSAPCGTADGGSVSLELEPCSSTRAQTFEPKGIASCLGNPVARRGVSAGSCRVEGSAGPASPAFGLGRAAPVWGRWRENGGRRLSISLTHRSVKAGWPGPWSEEIPRENGRSSQLPKELPPTTLVGGGFFSSALSARRRMTAPSASRARCAPSRSLRSTRCTVWHCASGRCCIANQGATPAYAYGCGEKRRQATEQVKTPSLDQTLSSAICSLTGNADGRHDRRCSHHLEHGC